MCEKLHNDRLRNDRALVLWKSDSKNPQEQAQEQEQEAAEEQQERSWPGSRFGPKMKICIPAYINSPDTTRTMTTTVGKCILKLVRSNRSSESEF